MGAIEWGCKTSGHKPKKEVECDRERETETERLM